MYDLKITLIQPDLFWQDKKSNLLKFEDFFQKLDRKTDLVVLPEMFNTGFVVDQHSLAEDMNGPTVEWMARKSAELKSVISGSLVVVENGNYFNRLVWMQPDGNFYFYNNRNVTILFFRY